jgi:hypothetical protein
VDGIRRRAEPPAPARNETSTSPQASLYASAMATAGST